MKRLIIPILCTIVSGVVAMLNPAWYSWLGFGYTSGVLFCSLIEVLFEESWRRRLMK
jgi:hypothetical protein